MAHTIADNNLRPSGAAKHGNIRLELEREKASYSTFTCFSNLPIELREQIWQAATPPRFITVNPIYYDNNLRRYIPGPVWNARCINPVSVPMVCRESRAIYRRNHPLYLKPLWVNPLLDTIFLDFPWDDRPRNVEEAIRSFCRDTECRNNNLWFRMLNARANDEDGKRNIRMLALSSDVLRCLLKYPQTLKMFDKFPALEEVVFLHFMNDPEAFDLRDDAAEDNDDLLVIRHDVLLPSGGLNANMDAPELGLPTAEDEESWQIMTTRTHRVISIPKSEMELEAWESHMSDVGWLRTKKSRFQELETTFAIRKAGISKHIVDERNGLCLFGPNNLSFARRV